MTPKITDLTDEEINAPQRKLSGLEKICRAYGRMKCGDTLMLWDYVSEKAVPASEMPRGSERLAASERSKYVAQIAAIHANAAPQDGLETVLMPKQGHGSGNGGAE